MAYVDWICSSCAQNNGGTWPDGHLGTFHENNCSVCHRRQLVTEPRDFRLVSDKFGNLFPMKTVTVDDVYMAMALSNHEKE